MSRKKGSKLDRILRRTRSEDIESDLSIGSKYDEAIADELGRVGLQMSSNTSKV